MKMRLSPFAKALPLGMLAVALSAEAGQIDHIEFKNNGTIEIRGNGLRGFVQQDKSDPPELVLTFNDTTLGANANKTIDTGALKTNVMQISSYPLNSGAPQARVVVDFKKLVKYTITETDEKLTIKVDKTGAESLADSESDVVSVSTTASAEEPVETAARALEKKFTGSPITLKLKDADVHEVLRLISDASGFNIVIHPTVAGRLTLQLERVPWDQALDVVLTTLKLGADRSQSVLRVMPREMFIAEKQAELESKKIAASAAPRITRIFPISYADLTQLTGILTSFANAQNSGPGSSGVPATIITDTNTQSLIVRETAENIERIRKMIQLLDVQTPQVLIEGKVIEASKDFRNSINGSLGATGTQLGAAFNGLNALVGNARISEVQSVAGGGTFAAVQGVTIFNKPIFMQALLNLAESDNRAKVVSSPRTVVLSGKTANITQSKAIAVTASVTTTTTTTNTLQSITANTKLSVTPRVTNDGSVFMKLDLSRDILNVANPTAPVVEPRNMSTEVIVDSGSTLVIGGILNLDESHVSQGIPFLRKIPLFGWLFGSESDVSAKSEVMFFVTPRVLNPRKAGAIVNEEPPAAVIPVNTGAVAKRT